MYVEPQLQNTVPLALDPRAPAGRDANHATAIASLAARVVLQGPGAVALGAYGGGPGSGLAQGGYQYQSPPPAGAKWGQGLLKAGVLSPTKGAALGLLGAGMASYGPLPPPPLPASPPTPPAGVIQTLSLGALSAGLARTGLETESVVLAYRYLQQQHGELVVFLLGGAFSFRRDNSTRECTTL